MASAFHWIKVKTVCYATEDEYLLHDTMSQLTGLDEDSEAFDVDISEGFHGNPITVIDADLRHSKEFTKLFMNIGRDVIEDVMSQLDDRIDDDCVIYMRLDKQKAVHGDYAISHSGDVISITGKLVAHPAKKEIAVKNAEAFFTRILQSLEAQAPSE